jgi:hypothetical protein
MEYFLTVAGLLWILSGVLVIGLSSSRNPELVACLTFSFGIMFIAVAALLARLRTFSATANVAEVSVFPPAAFAPPALPPPVPLDYAVPIEEAIDGVRSAARPAWIRSLEEITGTAIVDPAPVPSVVHPPHFAYAPPAYPAPAYSPPAYAPPAYAAPAYPAANYAAPTYPPPTYPAPTYPAPTYPATSYPPPAHPAPAYPAPAQYFRAEAFQAPTELVEIGGEYYVDPAQHAQEATALRRLQQIFSN